MNKTTKKNKPNKFKAYASPLLERITERQIEYNKLKIYISNLLLDSDPRNRVLIYKAKIRITDIENWVNNEGLIIEDHSSRESHPALRYVIKKQYPKVKSRYSQEKQKIDAAHIKQSKNTSDGVHNKYGYSHFDWQNMTKQHQVEVLADLARKDVKSTPNHWWDIFKAEFPEGYSTELARYRDKFKRKNRHEKFKKNGLMFYKGKE